MQCSFFSDIPNMLSMDLTNFDPSHVESIFDKQTSLTSSRCPESLGNSNHDLTGGGTMDVEDDVASWLDSLCSQQQNNQPNHSSGVPGSNTTGSSRCPESLGNTSSTAWTVKSELNGNVGDLMPRGDPLMGSFTNSILPANNDFDL